MIIPLAKGSLGTIRTGTDVFLTAQHRTASRSNPKDMTGISLYFSA